MTKTTGLAREVANRAKAAQQSREAAVAADRENRHAFLRGYWAGMCRRNCWTYSDGVQEDVRLQVSPRRLSWRALVGMARTAESFRRAQYTHLEAAVRQLSACAIAEHPHTRAWQRLGEAFGVSRDMMTRDLARTVQGQLGETLQCAAEELGWAALYATPKAPLVELDDYYTDENGEPKA